MPISPELRQRLDRLKGGSSAPISPELRRRLDRLKAKSPEIPPAEEEKGGLVSGFGKGAAESYLGIPLSLSRLISQMTEWTYPPTPGASAEEVGQEFEQIEAPLKATGTREKVGKGLEFGAELAAFGLPALLKRLPRKAAPLVSRVGPGTLRAPGTAGPVLERPALRQALIEGLAEARVAPTPPISLPTALKPGPGVADTVETLAQRVAQLERTPGATKAEIQTARVLADAALEARTATQAAKVPGLAAAEGGLTPTIQKATVAAHEALGAGKPVKVAVEQIEGQVAKALEQFPLTTEEAAEILKGRVRTGAEQIGRAFEKYGPAKAAHKLQPEDKVLKEWYRTVGKGLAQEIRETGRKVGQTLPNDPIAARDMLRKILGEEAGQVGTKGLAMAGLGAAGAATGAALGETPEERLLYGAGGAAAGLAVVPFMGLVLAKGFKKAAQQAVYTLVLASPRPLMKAYGGALGGAVLGGLEKIAGAQIERGLGRPDTARRLQREGTNILRRLFSKEPAQGFVKALRTPSERGGWLEGIDMEDTILRRTYGAMDRSVRPILTDNGYTSEQAAQLMLTGPGTSKTGQGFISYMNEHFGLRFFFSLFPRVGTQIVERGLERTPLGLVSKGLQMGGTQGERIARSLEGPLVGSLLYLYGDKIPPWLWQYVTAATGPIALPSAVGLAGSLAREKGKTPAEQARAMTGEFAGNLPLPEYGTAESFDPRGKLAMLVPALARDVAQMRDPYERETRDFPLTGRARAKIPGLREQLPARGAAVNIAGQPTEDRSSKIVRFLSSASPETRPMRGIPKDVAQEVQRLDVSINPPSYERTIKIGGKEIDLPPDLAERARAERAKLIVPEIQKEMASREYRRSDDERKKTLLKQAIERARRMGGRERRLTIEKLLKERK